MLTNRCAATAPAGARASADTARKAGAKRARAARDLSMRRRLTRMGKETLIARGEPSRQGPESRGIRAAEHGIARRISGTIRTAALRGRRRMAAAFQVRARGRSDAAVARALADAGGVSGHRRRGRCLRAHPEDGLSGPLQRAGETWPGVRLPA